MQLHSLAALVIQMIQKIACAVVLIGLLPVYATTYYVSTTGDDGNSGGVRAPFRHLSKAAASARHPGDTVIVMDGTYDNEGVLATPDGRGSVVSLKYSGSEKKPITFRALNRGKAILDAMNTSGLSCNGAWAYFDLLNASYIVIQGFVIQNGCYNGIRSNDNAHDITIKWNEIRNIGNWANAGGPSSPSGIFLNGNEFNFTFDGNIFHDIGGGTPFQEHAIYTSASNVTIVNNVFYNNIHGWGIQTSGGVNVLIANNTFAFPNPNTKGQLMLWDGRKTGSLSNVTVRNNIFLSPNRVAIVTNLVSPITGSCSIDHNITNAANIFDGGSLCNLSNNSVFTDPKLVNASNPPYDFHVQPDSPAIGTGVRVLDLDDDFEGAPRSGGASSDIGAYGFFRVTIPPIASVNNGASFLPTSVAPGQIISIRGSGMGPPTGIGTVLDISGLVDTLLAGTRVLFDGMAAPVLYASDGQVVAIVPYAIAGEKTTNLRLEFQGAISPAFNLEVAPAAPGLFTADSSGHGQGAILDQDFSPNSAVAPAEKGSVIAIYGTGEGQTDPPGIDGLIIDDTWRTPVLPVSVTIGGQPAEVLYAGSAPGLVAGVLQVDARIPDGIDSSAQVPVILTVGATSSAPGVTVAVP